MIWFEGWRIPQEHSRKGVIVAAAESIDVVRPGGQRSSERRSGGSEPKSGNHEDRGFGYA